MTGAVPPSVRPSPRKRVAGRLRRVAGYGALGGRNPAAFAAWGPPAHWAVSPSPRGGGRRGLDWARRWAGARLRRVAAQRPPVGPGARPVPRWGPAGARPVAPLGPFGVPRPSPRRCGPCRSSRSAAGVPAPQRRRGDALGAPWLPPGCLAAKESFLCYPSLLPLERRPLRATIIGGYST